MVVTLLVRRNYLRNRKKVRKECRSLGMLKYLRRHSWKYLNMMMNKEQRSIYIHIPFCQRKCIYCNFRSITDTSLVDDYIKGLIKEIVLYKDLLKTSIIETIYIGGGTPSFINEKHIAEIIDTIKEYNDLSHIKEITIEVNPGTLTKEKLMTYKAIGINRLSMGFQSSNNQMLKTIGRIHTFEEAKAAYYLARAVGFDN